MHTSRPLALAALLLGAALSCAPAFAQVPERATTDEAKAVLKRMLELAKTKGVAKAADDVNANDGAHCKTKDLGCLYITNDARVLAAPRAPALVGQQFPPDFADIDGTPITTQLVGPAKAGKTAWEAEFKANLPGTKQLVMRRYLCGKVDAEHFACAIYSK